MLNPEIGKFFSKIGKFSAKNREKNREALKLGIFRKITAKLALCNKST
jgi:hypothetical protein